MGGHRTKRRKTHLVEDQFGGAEARDRNDSVIAASGSGQRGRGESSVSSSNPSLRRGSLEYVKHVPAFLREHAHLLGHGHAGNAQGQPATYGASHSRSQTQGNGRYDTEKGTVAQEEQDDEKHDVEEALLQALEQRPELVKEYPELVSMQKKKEAEVLKEKGNTAFKEKRFEDAIDIFTRCIHLDDTNHVYYSNRAAAYIEMGLFEKAIDSARECVRLKSTWAKGYVRLGIALMRVGKAESVHVLRKAKALEPHLQGINELLSQAISLTKKPRDTAMSSECDSKQHKNRLLSFEDDDDDDDEVA